MVILIFLIFNIINVIIITSSSSSRIRIFSALGTKDPKSAFVA